MDSTEFGKEFAELFKEPETDPLEKEAMDTGTDVVLGLSSLTVFHGYAAAITAATGSALPGLCVEAVAVALTLKRGPRFIKAVRQLQKNKTAPKPFKPN